MRSDRNGMGRWRMMPIAFAAFFSGPAIAQSAQIDSSNDFHCYLLASFYGKVGDLQGGVSTEQQQAMRVMELWYSRPGTAASAHGRKLAAEAKPLLQAIDTDRRAAMSKAMACAQRATRNPGFSSFLRQHTP